MTSAIAIRRATCEDVETLIAMRVAMFRELSGVSEPLPDFVAATRDYLARSVPANGFLAWLAEAEGRVIATSGLVFFQRTPTPGGLSGRDAYLVNMYTEPAWRGRGIASALVERIVAYVREETDACRLFLRAEDAARPIYARAGFTPEETVMAISFRRVVAP
jgi:GNAT superfamily N-acetyltransferase